jgi:aminopeptidase-like protein
MWAVSCEFVFLDKCDYDLKTFSSQNLNMGIGMGHPEFYGDFETVEKNAKNLLTRKF